MPRVVVRGSGSIGVRHARVFASLGAEVGLWPVRPRPAGPDPGTGATLLDDRSGPTACAAADLVVVATDTARHGADAVLALDSGCARLLVEKPVAATVAAARELTAHPGADRVFVAAPLRAHRGFRLLSAQLADLPGPYAAAVHCQSWLPDWRPGRDYRESYSARADEGGVLRDLVHEIDYAAVLFGPPAPGAVAATLAREGPLEMAAEQAADLRWTTATGSVELRLDYVTRSARRGITVSGPVGALSWDVLTAKVRRTDEQGPVQEWQFAEDLDRDAVLATQARAALALAPGEPLPARLAAGAPATLAEGVLAVRICDDARSAAEGG